MIDFKGKVAVISGGGMGIGRAIVEGFLEAGAAVAVIEKDKARVESLSSRHKEVFCFHGDVTKADDVEEFEKQVAKKFGHIDTLVNNVGDFLLIFKPFEQQTDEELDSLYHANLGSVFRMTRAFLPLLRKAKGDRSIVSVASIEAHRAIPNAAAYAAFKSGITGFTKSLALELGPEGIRVNVVAPETTNSAQVPLDFMIAPEHRHHADKWIPLGRFGRPEDTAGAVFYLASPLAAWVTGTTVHVDGGALAAAGWYRDTNGVWTNIPMVTGNALNLMPENDTETKD